MWLWLFQSVSDSVHVAPEQVANYMVSATCHFTCSYQYCCNKGGRVCTPCFVPNLNTMGGGEYQYHSSSFLFPLFPVVLITDSIEANVESTAVHVEDANVQLDKARNYQVKHSLRKQTCCFVLSRLVLFVCLLLFVFSWGDGEVSFLIPSPFPKETWMSRR